METLIDFRLSNEDQVLKEVTLDGFTFFKKLVYHST